MSTKEVVMTEEWNESDDFKRVGTEGLSGEDIGQKSLGTPAERKQTGSSAGRKPRQQTAQKSKRTKKRSGSETGTPG